MSACRRDVYTSELVATARRVSLMIRTRFKCGCVAAVAALAFAATTAPAGEAANAYPTCNVFEAKPDRDNACAFGSGFGAVLIVERQDFLPYRLCARGPGDDFCVHRTTGERRRPSKIRLSHASTALRPTG